LLVFVIMALLLLGGTAQAGLTGFWNFEQDDLTPNTGVIHDLSAFGRDGEVRVDGAGAATISGDVPAALAGSSQYAFDLSANTAGSMNDIAYALFDYRGIIGAGPRTVSFWTKTSAPTDAGIIQWGNQDFGELWSLRMDDVSGQGGVQLDVYGGWRRPSTNISDNQWHHVAVVVPDQVGVDVTDTLFYIDGVQQTSFNDGPRAIDTAANLHVRLGLDSAFNKGAFSGLIDDVAVFNEALSPSEVTALAGGASPTGTVAFWQFDEGGYAPGDTVPSTSGALLDSVGGHHGTAVSNATNPTLAVYESGAPAVSDGKAIDFTAADKQLVQVPDADALDVFQPGQDVTIEAMIKATSSGRFISKADTTDPAYWAFRVDTTTLPGGGSPLKFFGNNGTDSFTFTGGTAVDDGQWHHVAAVINHDELGNATFQLFVDYEPDGSPRAMSAGVPDLSSSSPLNIGGWYPGGDSEYFDGSVDFVKISNRGLSPAGFEGFLIPEPTSALLLLVAVSLVLLPRRGRRG
jgi:hypothetical protein